MWQDLCDIPSLSQSANICVYIELCSQSISACSKKNHTHKKKGQGNIIGQNWFWLAANSFINILNWPVDKQTSPLGLNRPVSQTS